jgi:hypothetical protein
MSAKRRFTVKGVIGRFLFNPKEWEIDRETSFYYRLVNRETGMKKWIRKEYFHVEERNYPYRPCE